MSVTFLSARWENLVMANYEVPPAVLAAYLPHGVELDLYRGKAYVSLVGFLFRNTRLFKIPIPFWGTFEEINLRFYVKRVEGSTEKRGVVFINETVPSPLVAWVANRLYKEHYTAIPTKHTIAVNEVFKTVSYQWKACGQWNHLNVDTAKEGSAMLPDTMKEFIFEHYYGYTRVNESVSQEYRVAHARWNVHEVKAFDIHCDFGCMYGKAFAFLTGSRPHTVFMAEGSPVTVQWKRKTL